MPALRITERRRYLARRAEVEARFPRAVEAVREEVFRGAVEPALSALSRSRIKHNSPGGFAESFTTDVAQSATRAVFTTHNLRPYAHYVLAGRRPGQPVYKQYVNNAANRKRGRAGSSYVAHYTGMPPGGIFPDSAGRSDFPGRNTIAREGIPGIHTIDDIRAEFEGARLHSLMRPVVRRELFGRR